MQNDNTLNLGELASYLGWSTRFIEGLVRGEKLPSHNRDGQLVFRRDEIIEWLDRKIQTLDAARVVELDLKFEHDLLQTGVFKQQRPDQLTAQLPLEGILIDTPVDTKSAVLRTLVDLAWHSGRLLDREHLHASLLERESLISTALPGGIAICHPRRPLPGAIQELLLVFMRTAGAVDFGAPDGQPTRLYFLLCAPDDQSYLHSLARLSRILHATNVLDDLTSASTPEAVYGVLSEAERVIKR